MNNGDVCSMCYYHFVEAPEKSPTNCRGKIGKRSAGSCLRTFSIGSMYRLFTYTWFRWKMATFSQGEMAIGKYISSHGSSHPACRFTVMWSHRTCCSHWRRWGYDLLFLFPEQLLGGGLKYVFCSSLYMGKWSNLTNIFSNGLKPPTRFVYLLKPTVFQLVENV